MSELKALITNAIIILTGSLIVECESIYFLIIDKIDVPIFIITQMCILCMLALLYIEYREYNM